MPAYIIVEIEVTDPAAYEEYRRGAAATLASHGAKYLVRGGAAETLEGDRPPQRIVVVEFESMASARAWWNSEEYREPKALRQRCAITQMTLVEGV
ncbi:MAG: DUF1330 domain-containing protein [Chthoniobacterales bacterium]|nr:DUF1330 domain-containing protein [Chthoniobacterales bacterium]